MPIRITNRTIYTGRVGAPMRPRAIPRPSRRVHRKAIRLVGGPLNAAASDWTPKATVTRCRWWCAARLGDTRRGSGSPTGSAFARLFVDKLFVY